jgi:hypothetical protein
VSFQADKRLCGAVGEQYVSLKLGCWLAGSLGYWAAGWRLLRPALIVTIREGAGLVKQVPLAR